jgi:hypothetical protein
MNLRTWLYVTIKFWALHEIEGKLQKLQKYSILTTEIHEIKEIGTTPRKLYHYRHEAMTSQEYCHYRRVAITSNDVPTVTSLESCYKEEDERLLRG